ncbi:MAG: DUF484 family protein [Pseudomonadales bacterium]|nr:DUF484 family protein [Pseudomonadales bacterium]NNL11735.1 DUF484 family protein [Pseudomonadales bacterium]
MSNANFRSAKKNVASEATAIEDQQVLDYLRANPDFFRLHPEAVANLTLPHNSGAAVSLVERQVAVLRERSIQSRRKMSDLVDIAKDNDQLFECTQALVIALLKAGTVDGLLKETRSQFKERFGVQRTALLFLSQPQAADAELEATGQQRELTAANESVGHLLDEQQTFCGVLRDSESSFIFGSSERIGSAAVTTRKVDEGFLLLLAVANDDSDHYSQDTGTLFIDYIADILALRLQQLR